MESHRDIIEIPSESHTNILVYVCIHIYIYVCMYIQMIILIIFLKHGHHVIYILSSLSSKITIQSSVLHEPIEIID